MLMLLLLIAFGIGKASLINSISTNTLQIFLKRWNPHTVDFEDKPSIISMTRGGLKRYTNIVVASHAPSTSHGIMCMDYMNRLSLFAIQNRSNNYNICASITTLIDDEDFHQTVKEVKIWHKNILNMPLSIEDEFSIYHTTTEDTVDDI